MTLRLLDSLSLPGDKPNEDAFAHDGRVALVLDGATPLGPALLPGPSDAAWIAQFGARRLLAHLKDGDAPQDALAHALGDAEKSFAGLSRKPVQEKWQTPCAAMMLVVDTSYDRPPPRAKRMEGEGEGEQQKLPRSFCRPNVAGSRASESRRGLEFMWYGDCAALVSRDGAVTMIGEAMEARKREAGRARLVSQETKKSATDRTAFLPLLRASRNRINSGRNWLFSPDARAAAHVSRQTERLAPGTLLLLASDGFLALVTDYGAYDLAGLMAAAKDKGLAALGEELRAIEAADPEGEKFARFKTNDDATALLLEVIDFPPSP
jgi:serine/threonine protein phosphatase PrpC